MSPTSRIRLSMTRRGEDADLMRKIEAIGPKGNIIVGESQGYRVQKFIYKGLSTRSTR